MAEILLDVQFRVQHIIGLVNWLKEVNTALFVEQPELPLLYDSGVLYSREQGETFRDVVGCYRQGQDDCDTLAPIRAGELMARGWRAMRPGDAGYDVARLLKPKSIAAWCFFTTRSQPTDPGPRLYHVEVAYTLGGERYEDDPSARLGMYDGRIDPVVAARWERAGISPGQPVSVGYLPVKVMP